MGNIVNNSFVKGDSYTATFKKSRNSTETIKGIIYLGKLGDGTDYFMWHGYGEYIRVNYRNRKITRNNSDYDLVRIT